MIITKNIKQNKSLIKMSNKSFNAHMCKKYPKIFANRYKPMSETCMCWGFSIGRGWHQLVNDLCAKLDLLSKVVRVDIKATQVKEKFGSLRFYTTLCFNKRVAQIKQNFKINNESAKLIYEILDNCIADAENKSIFICAKCGETYFKKIIIGGWVYDICEECFIKINPNRIKSLNNWKQHGEFSKFMKFLTDNYLHKSKYLKYQNIYLDKKCENLIDNLFNEFKKIQNQNTCLNQGKKKIIKSKGTSIE